MSKDDVIEAEGKVIEALPNELYQNPRRRQRKAGNESVRFDERKNHLAQQVLRGRLRINAKSIIKQGEKQ